MFNIDTFRLNNTIRMSAQLYDWQTPVQNTSSHSSQKSNMYDVPIHMIRRLQIIRPITILVSGTHQCI